MSFNEPQIDIASIQLASGEISNSITGAIVDLLVLRPFRK